MALANFKNVCISPVVDLALLHPDGRVMGGAVGCWLVARVHLGSVLVQLGTHRFIYLNINININYSYSWVYIGLYT